MNAIQEIERLLELRGKCDGVDGYQQPGTARNTRGHMLIENHRTSMFATFEDDREGESYFASANATEALRKLLAIAKAATRDVSKLKDGLRLLRNHNHPAALALTNIIAFADAALQAAKEAK